MFWVFFIICIWFFQQKHISFSTSFLFSLTQFCGIFSYILYQSGLINDKFRWTAKVLKFCKKTSSQFSHMATLFRTICANSKERKKCWGDSNAGQLTHVQVHEQWYRQHWFRCLQWWSNFFWHHTLFPALLVLQNKPSS